MRCGAVVSLGEQARLAARWKTDIRKNSSAGQASTPPQSDSSHHERCATMGFSIAAAAKRYQLFWTSNIRKAPYRTGPGHTPTFQLWVLQIDRHQRAAALNI